MATLEQGKGRRKRVVQITQHGSTLRLQENEGGDDRLPGYQAYRDAAAARAGLADEVRGRIADGMAPADDDARGIAAAMPARNTGGAPRLPLRRDLRVYNEANGFVVTSRKLAGKTLEEGASAWKKAVLKGDLLPLTLVQDDGFVIRVVAGAPLSGQEEAEWVARLDWHLNVPDGKLCVTGGSVFTTDGYDADDPYYEQFVGEVAVPKGRYRASLYTYAHGVNGASVLDHLAGGYGKSEPIESWFARTRPTETRADVSGLELVDFLLHLDPVAEAPRTGLATLPEDGWFGGAEAARKPALCPTGLIALDVQRARMAGESRPNWTYVRHVFERLPSFSRQPVAGGAVRLPLDALARAARLAWFGSRLTTFELRVSPAAGTPPQTIAPATEGVAIVDEGGVWRILFDVDLPPAELFGTLNELAGPLKAAADGAWLDLCAVVTESLPGYSPDGPGLLSFGGRVTGSTWNIEEAHPAVDAATLRAAIALAAETEGSAITVEDANEGEAILAWATRCYGAHLEENPPSLVAGRIQFEQGGHEVALLGVAAFAIRFASTWPHVDIPAPDEEDGWD